MLNQSEIKNNWSQIKTQIRGQYNRLTDDELEKTHGNVKELSHLVSAKYGYQKNFERDLERICESCASKPVINKDVSQKGAVAGQKSAGVKTQAARDEFRSPQDPKKETQTPKMQNGDFSTQSSSKKR